MKTLLFVQNTVYAMVFTANEDVSDVCYYRMGIKIFCLKVIEVYVYQFFVTEKRSTSFIDARIKLSRLVTQD